MVYCNTFTQQIVFKYKCKTEHRRIRVLYMLGNSLILTRSV